MCGSTSTHFLRDSIWYCQVAHERGGGMKKVTQNLFISIGVGLVLVIMMLILMGVTGILGSGVKEIKEDIDTIYEDGEVDTVEGHGAIMEGGLMVVGAFAGVFLIGLICFMAIFAFVLILIAVIARLVFAKQGTRLVLYRILMGIEYLFQAIVAWVCMDVALDNLRDINFICLLVGIAVTVGTIYSARNTYSERICE